MSVFDKFRLLLEHMKAAGFPATFRYYFNWLECLVGRPRAGTFHLQPKGVRYPVTLRAGTSSDNSVFRQIFFEREYEPLYRTNEFVEIIDLGANTGLASIDFLNHFPNARVFAVEPDPENHRICVKNLAPYNGRARAICAAAWSHPAKLALSRFRDSREWAVTVVEAADDAPAIVQAWDIPSILAMSGFETVDLLKIDIERSEIQVFNSAAEQWIPRVRNLCIELHGEDCQEAFFGAMSNFEYELEHSGELWICRNIRRSMRP